MLIRNIFILMTLVSTMAYAEPAPSVVGTWKLISMERQQCLSPNGFLIYSAEGYMSVGINCMKMGDDNKLTLDPGKAIFYAGTYVLHDHTMTHHIINANTAEFFGKDIDRAFAFETGNKIVFSGKTPSGEVSRLVWERVTSK